jgi:hypothetical protein
VALVRSLGLELHSPLTLRLGEQDLSLLQGIAQGFTRPPPPPSSSPSPLPPGPQDDWAAREGRRDLHQHFRVLDDDHDGRLTVPQVQQWLSSLGEGLPLTRSELATQVGRLAESLGLGPEATVTWRELRRRLEEAAKQYMHGDWLLESLRCGELASLHVGRDLFGARGADNLSAHLASLSPEDESLAPFWALLEAETGVAKGECVSGGKGVHLQLQLLRTLRHYALARDTWRLLVLPAMLDLPFACHVSRDGCELMGAPVGVGDAVFSDLRGVEIAALPAALEGQVLVGLRTPHRDRKSTAPRYLSLTLSRPAVVYVCLDCRLPRLPKWLTTAGFKESLAMGPLRTSDGAHHRLFAHAFAAGPLTLGGNEGKGRHVHNYFLLLARLPPAQPPPDGAPPPWLLHEASPAMPTPCRTLHAHVFQSLGISTPSSGLRGGDEASRAASQDAQRSSQEGMLSGVERLLYRLNVSIPGLTVHLVDPRRVFSERLTARLKWATARLTLEHCLRGGQAWLGHNDRLVGHVSLSLEALYFNPSLGLHEWCLEPWEAHCSLANERDCPLTTLRLAAERHLNLNLSPHLVDVLRRFILQAPRALRGAEASRYRQALGTHLADGPRRTRVLLLNRLGVPLTLHAPTDSCRLAPLEAVSDLRPTAEGEEEEDSEEEEGEVARLTASAQQQVGYTSQFPFQWTCR